MTPMNDADREAFEAAWDAIEDMSPAVNRLEEAKRIWQSALSHARQPGEPVALVQHECGGCGHRWMAPMHPDQNCPACNPANDTEAAPTTLAPTEPIPLTSGEG